MPGCGSIDICTAAGRFRGDLVIELLKRLIGISVGRQDISNAVAKQNRNIDFSFICLEQIFPRIFLNEDLGHGLFELRLAGSAHTAGKNQDSKYSEKAF